jgi:CheY-like chemotaxis protein
MSPAPQQQPTLLIVEDNDVAREAFASALRQGGYTVVTVADGAEAWDYLRAGPRPDLILLDMLMPRLDGWLFLRRLRQQAAEPPIPVIIMTSTILTREWAETHGCHGFLRKPFEPAQLLEEVRRCLDQGP